ncbi:MAG: hypothetical protein GHCLOJNM_00029 [bacterium]|nr:hypothetical protein [bacterium]
MRTAIRVPLVCFLRGVLTCLAALLLRTAGVSAQPGDPSGYALSFDGTALLSTPSVQALHLNTGGLTLEAWVKLAGTGDTWQVVLSKGLSGNPYGISVNLDRRLQFELHPGVLETGPGLIQFNVWTHLAATWDGVQMRLYQNGVLVGSRARFEPIGVVSTPFVVGSGSEQGNYEDFEGLIDEIRLWSVARTSEEINADMKRYLIGSEPGLIAYWTFDEGTGQVAQDLSPNAISLQLGREAGSDSYDPVWVASGIPGFKPLLTSAGEVSFSQEVYACTSVLQIEVRDLDLEGVSSIPVSVSSTLGDLETVTLDGIAGLPGILRGTIQAAAGPLLLGNGTLETADSNQVAVRYSDSDDGTGSPSVPTATVSLDCLPPTALQVNPNEVTGLGATVVVQTNEAANAQVVHGTDCAHLIEMAASEGFSTASSVFLTQLQPHTRYFFKVLLQDRVGNQTLVDNSGACFEFETTGFPGPPFFDGFESGRVDSRWTVTGTNDYRVRASGDFGPPSGSFHMLLDDSGVSSSKARNEATLILDLEGCEKVALSFLARRIGGDLETPPLYPIRDGANFDGVMISEDGVQWFEIYAYGIGQSYERHVIDLDLAAASFGLKFNSAFRIRFNQYGSGVFPSEGLAIDDVMVNAEPKGRLSVQPTNDLVLRVAPDGSFPPECKQFLVRNQSPVGIDWVAAAGQSWLEFSPNAGSLAPGESAPVSVCATTAVLEMNKAEFPGHISFVDIGAGQAHDRGVRAVLGASGYGLSFAGSDRLRAPLFPSLANQPLSAFTLGAWVYPLSGTGSDTDLFQFEANSPFRVSILNNGRVDFRVNTTSTFTLSSPVGVASVDRWSHLYLTWEGAVMRIFVNGVEVASKPTVGTLVTPTGPFTISNDSFLGMIDEVALWKRAFGPDEVADYQFAVSPSDPDLLVYWPFEEGAGQATHGAAPHRIAAVLGASGGPDDQDPQWISSRIPFLKPSATSEGRLRVDREAYSCSDTVKVFLRDIDMTGLAPRVEVNLTPGGDMETLALAEDSVTPGVFRGAMRTEPGAIAPLDGVLQPTDEDELRITYHELDTGLGATATVSVTASLDCAPPTLELMDVEDYVTGVIFTMNFDEPASLFLLYGLSCDNLDQTYSVGEFAQEYEFTLRNLLPEQTYHYRFEVADRLGNSVILGATGGDCFRFVTSGLPQPPFHEDFESGVLDPYWEVTGTGSHRAEVESNFAPHSGSQHVVMDNPSGYSRNEVTLFMDLEGWKNLVLSFWAKSLGDESHGPPPNPFSNGADFDGVAISVNGTHWHEVIGLRGIGVDYQQFSVDLDQALRTHNLSLSPVFRIRFNQYDNSAAPTDGIAFDDVSVLGVRIDPLVVLPDEPFLSRASEGSPFDPSFKRYTLSNSAETPFDWSGEVSEAWLNIHPASGTLAFGQPVSVTVTLNEEAALLSRGTHRASLGFANLSTAATVDRAVAVRVVGPCYPPVEPSGPSPFHGEVEVSWKPTLEWEQHSPPGSDPIRVLVFAGGADTSAGSEYQNTISALLSILPGAQIQTSVADTEETLAEELGGVQALLIPEQERWTSSNLGAWGARMKTALRVFVELGGVVVFADDDQGAAGFGNGSELLPIASVLASQSATHIAQIVLSNHPVMGHVTNPVTLGANHTLFRPPYSGDPVVLVYTPEATGAVVMTKTLGHGGVVALAWDFATYNDNQAQILANAVRWTDQLECPLEYDVYFGKVNPPTDLICADVSYETCFAGRLDADTTYYWQVVTRNCCGEAIGPVWSFTTMPCRAPSPFNPSPGRDEIVDSLQPLLTWDDLPFQQEEEPLRILAARVFTDQSNYDKVIASINVQGEMEITPLLTSHPAFDLEGALRRADVFLIPDPSNVPPADFLDWGRSAAANLIRFVEQGGVLIFTDTYSIAPEFLRVTGLLDVEDRRESASPSGRTCRRSGLEYPILEGLPSTFQVIGDHVAYPGTSNGTVLIRRADTNQPNVIHREIGRGFVLLIGWRFSRTNTDMSRLLTNAIFIGKGISQQPRYRVFFGTEDALTTVLCENLRGRQCQAPLLSEGTTYFWRVEGENPCGVGAGPVWSFETSVCEKPLSLRSPNPRNGEDFAPLNPNLSWDWDPFGGSSPRRILALDIEGASASASLRIEDAIGRITGNFTFTRLQTGDPGALEEALEESDTFIIPEQPWTREEMRFWAHSVSEIVERFASRGGSIILASDEDTGPTFVNETGMMSIEQTIGSRTQSTICQVLAPSHPIMGNLPATFEVFRDHTAFSGVAGGVPLLASLAYGNSFPMLVARQIGRGGFVAMAWDFREYNLEMARVIAQAAVWPSRVICDSFFDVYLDTENPPQQQIALNLGAMTVAAPTLSPETQYFWRVVAGNCCGETVGPVWSFTTRKHLCEDGYYLLDSFGGRHRVGTPPVIQGSLLFSEPIARSLESVVVAAPESMEPDLAVLDGFGVVHFVGSPSEAPAPEFMFPPSGAFPKGRAVDFEMTEDDRGFWVLTDFGGIYRAGTAKEEDEPPVVPGTDQMGILGFDVPFGQMRAPTLPNPGGASLRAVSLIVIDHDRDSRAEGYIFLDSQGGPHFLQPDGRPFEAGSLSGLPMNHPLRLLDPAGYIWPFFPGLDILRASARHSSIRGVLLLDGWGGLHPVPNDSETNPVFFATNRTSVGDPTPRHTVGMPYIVAGFDDPATPGVDEGDPSAFGMDTASIFKQLAFGFCEGGFYTLDRYGGIYTFGTTRPIESELPPRFEGSPNFYPWLRAEDMVFFPSD